MQKEDIRKYYDKIAEKRIKWKKRNRFYHKLLEKYIGFIIPENSNILEIGCGTGILLNSMKPKYGVGIDFAPNMVNIAREKFPHLKFIIQDAEDLNIDETFDYIILSDLVNTLWDIQKVFSKLHKVSHPKTRIIITTYNSSWEYVLRFAEFLRLKVPQPIHNWLTTGDLNNLCMLEGYEIIKNERKTLLPLYIPLLNFIFNKALANLPIINRMNLINIITARPVYESNENFSVSIVVPARNEKGNIENAILRTPEFGTYQEFIFVEGNSSDGTYDEILRVKEKYKDHKIEAFKQSGKGKGNAVREAFDRASGDILMILDADLTTPPEELNKFYYALIKNKGEFINGCRLVYPMEKEAMRFLNLMGNKFFGFFFTYLLGQRLKDTLCGTKVLFKSDYEKIKQNRSYFGDFDPFGDFDLLFGAAKLNLKIVEIIVRYKERLYGSTQIRRFYHGLLLFKMSFFAARKFKFK